MIHWMIKFRLINVSFNLKKLNIRKDSTIDEGCTIKVKSVEERCPIHDPWMCHGNSRKVSCYGNQ